MHVICHPYMDWFIYCTELHCFYFCRASKHSTPAEAFYLWLRHASRQSAYPVPVLEAAPGKMSYRQDDSSNDPNFSCWCMSSSMSGHFLIKWPSNRPAHRNRPPPSFSPSFSSCSWKLSLEITSRSLGVSQAGETPRQTHQPRCDPIVIASSWTILDLKH